MDPTILFARLEKWHMSHIFLLLAFIIFFMYPSLKKIGTNYVCADKVSRIR
jgi:hypothetical protein